LLAAAKPRFAAASWKMARDASRPSSATSFRAAAAEPSVLALSMTMIRSGGGHCAARGAGRHG